MEYRQIIDKEISTNYQKYLAYCYKLYKGNQLHKDLMQEAYISLTLMPENKLASLLTKCKLPTIISKVIYFTHKNRLRKNSNLSDFNYTDLYDLATEPVQESRDPTITIEKIKKEHPAHFEFIKECLAIKNKTGAQRAELFRTRNILKKTYNGTRID